MNKFEKILLTIFFVELFIGGGGRLIDFGILSIRQVLFLLLLLTFAYRVIKTKSILDPKVNTFIRSNLITAGIYMLLLWFIVSAVIGVINGHALSIIVMDFFRVSFFLAFFPLAYYISEERFPKDDIISILKKCSLIVAIFTITISLLGKTVFSDNFAVFYNFMNWIMNDDLFFRPSNSVFYKSHLFVFIGVILSLNAVLSKKYSRLDWAIVIVGIISILWSETRGFLLAFMASVMMIIILDGKIISDPFRKLTEKIRSMVQSRWYLKKLSLLIVIMIAVPFLYKYMTLERFQEEANIEDSYEEDEFIKDEYSEEQDEPVVNDESVNTRLEFILDSKNILLESPVNSIIGTGYGTEIANRLDGIEMSFLDILVEQGAIGLGIWFFLFFLVFYNYYVGYKKRERLYSLEISLIAAFTGVLLVTNINPFINNPIGITFFLIILVLSQNWKDTHTVGEVK